MINLTRRKRQAQENTGPLILAVARTLTTYEIFYPKTAKIHSREELDGLIREIEPGVVALAQSLYPDWAIPIVLQAVGELYYGAYKQFNFCGNYFKRAVAYLWQNSVVPHGTHKNMDGLIKLVCQCYMLEILYSLRILFIAIPDFYFSFKNGYVFIPNEHQGAFQEFSFLSSGKGKRLRIAEVNSKLMNEQMQAFLPALRSVLDGKPPSEIAIFQKTFYEKIPGIENEACARFWKEIFFRYNLYFFTLAQCIDGSPPTAVTLFPEFAVMGMEKYLTQKIITNSFWNRTWFEKQSRERYGNLLVDKPVVRISPGGDFATSPVLIGDSLNQFVEQQLLRYSTRDPYLSMPDHIFRDAFSEEFENQCIELFQKRGYLAGHVSEKGIWKHQTGSVDLNFSVEKLYGEIDVLACHTQWPVSILVECKVLLDAQDSRSYQNMVSKLRDDSEGFRGKLRKKADWVSGSLQSRFPFPVTLMMVLVTDIPMPVLQSDDTDIFLTYFSNLKDTLDSIETQLSQFDVEDSWQLKSLWKEFIDTV